MLEVEGVSLRARVLQETVSDTTASSSSPLGGRKNAPPRRENPIQPSKQSTSHDPGGTLTEDTSDLDDSSLSMATLPTTADLAKSFLETERAVKRENIEAVISSRSEDVQSPEVINTDEGEDGLTGTAIGLSLPSFLTGFLKGISDRLEIRIKDVELSVDTNLPSDVTYTEGTATRTNVTIYLRAEEITIDKVTVAGPEDQDVQAKARFDNASSANRGTTEKQPSAQRGCVRRVALRNLHLSLLSDASVFASFLRSSGPSSPSTVQRSISSDHSNIRLEQKQDKAQSVQEDLAPPQSTKSTMDNSVAQSSSQPRGLQDETPEHVQASQTLGGTDDCELRTDAARDSLVAPLLPPVASTARSRQRKNDYQEGSVLLRRSQDSHDNISNDEDFDGLSTNILSTASAITREGIPTHTFSHSEQGNAPMPESTGFASIHHHGDPPEGSSVKAHTHTGVRASGVEDLSESKIFSHEEAQSMYMSALSCASSSQGDKSLLPEMGKESRSGHVPLAEHKGEEFTVPLQQISQGPRTESGTSPSILRDSVSALEELRRTTSHSALSSGRSQLPTDPNNGPVEADDMSKMAAHESEPLRRLAKRVLYIDEAIVWVPVSSSSNAPDVDQTPKSSGAEEPEASGWDEATYSIYSSVPGAFSTVRQKHQTRPSGHGKGPSSPRPVPENPSPLYPQSSNSSGQPNPIGQVNTSTFSVSVAKCLAQIDAPIGRLIIVLVQIFTERLSNEAEPDPPVPRPLNDQTVFDWQINAQTILLKLLDRLPGSSLAFESSSSSPSAALPASKAYEPPDDDVLLRVTLTSPEVKQTTGSLSTDTSFSVKKAVLGYAKDDIISFDAGLRLRESIRDLQAPADTDVSVLIHQSPSYCKVKVVTLPVHVDFDLQRLDETLAWFGGVSSILGLGNSITSLTTVTPSGPAHATSLGHTRTVRFETPHDETQPTRTSTQNKLDARLGGFVLDLNGKDCSIRLDTTAIKFVLRDEGVGAQVDIVKLSGPYLRNSSTEANVTLDIGNVRMDYLPLPTEADLGRLLCLLSPSNNKYEMEDDILVETLLRQRKHGPVLRVTVERLSGRAEGLTYLSHLSSLSEEIAQLSTVTKYLPEDDRAGLLILGLIRAIDLDAHVNSELGRVSLRSRNLEASYVSLPLLLAMSLESVRIFRGTGEELLGEARSLTSRESTSSFPMAMARLIGDEMEPTLKIKLRGVLFEYRVSVLTALTEVVNNNISEENIAGLARSVAGFGERQFRQQIVPGRESQVSSDERYRKTSKYMKANVIFRDCILGLNPVGMPSKGLVVLTDMRFAGGRSSNDLLQMTLEIRKSSLLIVDDTDRVTPGANDDADLRRQVTKNDDSQASDLCGTGFVSVAYISSATLALHEQQPGPDGKMSLDLQLNDNLLVLETCADSTQTLLSLFNGLTPSQSPSKDLKYRTEIVPIQDMLASLSGDAFSPVGQQGHFEDLPIIVEEDSVSELHPEQDYLSVLDDETADLESASQELIQDDYEVKANDNDRSGEWPSLTKGGLSHTSHGRHQLVEEALEFQENHFAVQTETQAAAHRWDSVRNKYGTTENLNLLGSPLKIMIRDVHVIWNLFDGYDWPKTRTAINQAVEDMTIKARQRQTRREFTDSEEEDESVIGDFLFNSIYIGIPANRDPKDLANQINRNVDDQVSETGSTTFTTSSRPSTQQARPPQGKGRGLRLGRSRHHKMAFELKGITMDLIVFPPGSGETQSSIDVRVRDFEIFDHVPTSTWRKFATYMHDAGARESGSDMLHLEILSVQPVPELAASEMVLKVWPLVRKNLRCC